MSDLHRPAVLLAGVLFGLGLLVLLSPVSTDIPRDGQQGNNRGEFSRVCGLTLVQAFAAPEPQARGADRDSALDCAAAARGRVGYGLLLLLLALPPAGVAVMAQQRAADQ